MGNFIILFVILGIAVGFITGVVTERNYTNKYNDVIVIPINDMEKNFWFERVEHCDFTNNTICWENTLGDINYLMAIEKNEAFLIWR